VLVLAVAGGAWALFGRSSSKSDAAAIGPKVPSSTAPQRPAGPVVPGTIPTSPGPVAATAGATATQPAATTSPKPAPTKAPVATTPQPTRAPASKPTPAAPPVTAPQQGGTVAKKAYTFRVARGDTLWELTQSALRSTGRSTSNASTAAYVAKLYSANRAVIGSDPDLILVGTTITWPAGL
jgi:nucleoid-associated protein YgaU